MLARDGKSKKKLWGRREAERKRYGGDRRERRPASASPREKSVISVRSHRPRGCCRAEPAPRCALRDHRRSNACLIPFRALDCVLVKPRSWCNPGGVSTSARWAGVLMFPISANPSRTEPVLPRTRARVELRPGKPDTGSPACERRHAPRGSPPAQGTSRGRKRSHRRGTHSAELRGTGLWVRFTRPVPSGLTVYTSIRPSFQPVKASRSPPGDHPWNVKS